MSGDGDEKYLDPRFNPFLPQDEPKPKRSPEPDPRAPFEPIEKDPEKASGGLSEILEKEFPGGGIVELGGIKVVRLLGAWALEDGTRIEAIPADLMEKLEKAIREKEGG